jgi:hypothetical protein
MAIQASLLLLVVNLLTDIFLWVTSAPSIIIIIPALLEKIEIPWPRF